MAIPACLCLSVPTKEIYSSTSSLLNVVLWCENVLSVQWYVMTCKNVLARALITSIVRRYFWQPLPLMYLIKWQYCSELLSLATRSRQQSSKCTFVQALRPILLFDGGLTFCFCSGPLSDCSVLASCMALFMTTALVSMPGNLWFYASFYWRVNDWIPPQTHQHLYQRSTYHLQQMSHLNSGTFNSVPVSR